MQNIVEGLLPQKINNAFNKGALLLKPLRSHHWNKPILNKPQRGKLGGIITVACMVLKHVEYCHCASRWFDLSSDLGNSTHAFRIKH